MAKFEEQDPNAKIYRGITKAIWCYKDIFKKKRKCLFRLYYTNSLQVLKIQYQLVQFHVSSFIKNADTYA